MYLRRWPSDARASDGGQPRRPPGQAEPTLDATGLPCFVWTSVRITLGYFEGCPNWQVAYERLAQALGTTGHEDLVIKLVPVTSEEEAVSLGFAGSPTIYIDGVDPFAEETPRSGLSCRLYRTPEGAGGAPSLDQLVASLTGVR